MRRIAILGAALLAGLLLLPAGGTGQESCVACHSDPQFLVTNKKLYDYYRAWEVSVHGQEGVTCSDCHGGDPDADTKEAAHQGAGIAAASESSPVSYRNVPQTCAVCHDVIYEKYAQSKHYQHLVDNEDGMAEQGPNCVTCHGSVSPTVLTVNTVSQTCRSCHNPETENHPEMPEEAQTLLNQFLSIDRYFRYVTIKGSEADLEGFNRRAGRMIRELAATWHTFQIDAIEPQTRDILTMLKEQREKIRSRTQSR